MCFPGFFSHSRSLSAFVLILGFAAAAPAVASGAFTGAQPRTDVVSRESATTAVPSDRSRCRGSVAGPRNSVMLFGCRRSKPKSSSSNTTVADKHVVPACRSWMLAGPRGTIRACARDSDRSDALAVAE
jgi:hypothetical protein